MTYINLTIDLDKCSISTLFEIWLYSKDNDKLKNEINRIKKDITTPTGVNNDPLF